MDLVTAGLVVQGVKLAVVGVKEAAKLAKEAFHELNECVDEGRTLAESMGSVTKFFSSTAKYEQHRNDLQKAQEKQEKIVEETGETPPNYISDVEYVLEMMAIDREIKQYYEAVKTHLIYGFSEPGLWDEFQQRLHKLRSDREAKAEAKRQAETEKRLHEASLKMKARRERQKKLETLQAIVAMIVVVIIVCAFGYAMRIMLSLEGTL